MKLLEALKIINAPDDPSLASRQFVLATGFTPLALESFFHAHLRARMPSHNVRVSSGRFGDLSGNLERAAAAKPDGVAVVIEWSDVDRRLGVRGLGAVTGDAADDLVATVIGAFDRLAAGVAAVSAVAP